MTNREVTSTLRPQRRDSGGGREAGVSTHAGLFSNPSQAPHPSHLKAPFQTIAPREARAPRDLRKQLRRVARFMLHRVLPESLPRKTWSYENALPGKDSFDLAAKEARAPSASRNRFSRVALRKLHRCSSDSVPRRARPYRKRPYLAQNLTRCGATCIARRDGADSGCPKACGPLRGPSKARRGCSRAIAQGVDLPLEACLSTSTSVRLRS